MKQLFVRPMSQFSLLATLLFSQFVFADLPLKKDDPDPGSLGYKVASYSTFTDINATVNDITVDTVGSDLMINFNSPIGIATVSINDINGNTAYQTTVDTNSTSEVIVPINLLDEGNYTVTVTYGSTVYTEQIQL